MKVTSKNKRENEAGQTNIASPDFFINAMIMSRECVKTHSGTDGVNNPLFLKTENDYDFEVIFTLRN